MSDEIPVGSPPAPPGRHAAPGGWYADPVDQARERYWDGWQWTRNVRPRQGGHGPASQSHGSYAAQDPGGQRQYDQAYGQAPYGHEADGRQPEAYGQAPYGQEGYGQQPGAYGQAPYGQAPYGQGGYEAPYGQAPQGQGQWGGYAPGYQMVPSTADGVPLAGWGWRVLAFLIDTVLISIVVEIIATLTGLSARVDQSSREYTAYIQEVLTTGGSFDWAYAAGLLATPASMIINLMTVVAFIIYSGVMLSKRGATVGKMICRLRVVPVDRGQSGPALETKTAWLRPTVTQAFGIIPPLSLVNYLWPLWDKKKQTLHDKVVKTQVVREPRR